jgi:hypothetical protein
MLQKVRTSCLGYKPGDRQHTGVGLFFYAGGGVCETHRVDGLGWKQQVVLASPHRHKTTLQTTRLDSWPLAFLLHTSPPTEAAAVSFPGGGFIYVRGRFKTID